ncbi:MAG: TetR family transcriptional regulator C-terminal domain-containing protein [Bacteroidota bacterium]
MKPPTDIQTAYQNYVLQHGHRPASVRAFAESLDMEERVFYEHFSSFPHIEQALFLRFFEQATERLEGSPEYEAYGTPEKLLALFYTWIEVLTGERSFLVFLQHEYGSGCGGASYTEGTGEEFRLFVKSILKEGMANGEVADRLFVPRYYRDVFWLEAKGILRFWLRDNSKNFEKTDALIEKTVRFSYDIIRPNTLDSGLDLIKYMWQNR